MVAVMASFVAFASCGNAASKKAEADSLAAAAAADSIVALIEAEVDVDTLTGDTIISVVEEIIETPKK